MTWSGFVRFDLADHTTVIVERDDLQRIYEELWVLSDVPGAITTAALLINQMGRHPPFRETVNLDSSQSTALRRAVDDCET